MNIVLALLTTSRQVEKAGQRLFRPLGLTVAQFNVLNLLADEKEGLRAGDLAKALVVDPSNVTGLLSRMGEAGWLEDIASESDGRHRVVRLSPTGRGLWKKANHIYEGHLRVIDRRITAHDMAILRRGLAAIGSVAVEID